MLVAGLIEHDTGDLNMIPFAPRIHPRFLAAALGAYSFGGTKTTEFMRPSCRFCMTAAVEANSTSPSRTADCPVGRVILLGTPRASLTLPFVIVRPTGYLFAREAAPMATAMTALPIMTMGKAAGSNGVPMKARNIRKRGAIPKSVAMTFVAPMAGERSTRFNALSSSGVSGLSKTVSNGSISCGLGGGGGMPIPAIDIGGAAAGGAIVTGGSILPHRTHMAYAEPFN